jgi:hypothetical protein
MRLTKIKNRKLRIAARAVIYTMIGVGFVGILHLLGCLLGFMLARFEKYVMPCFFLAIIAGFCVFGAWADDDI